MPYLSPTRNFGIPEAKPHDELVAELMQKGWSMYLSGPGGTELLQPREIRPLDVVAVLVGAAAIPMVNLYAGLALVALALLDNLVLTERRHLFVSRRSPELSDLAEL